MAHSAVLPLLVLLALTVSLASAAPLEQPTCTDDCSCTGQVTNQISQGNALLQQKSIRTHANDELMRQDDISDESEEDNDEDEDTLEEDDIGELNNDTLDFADMALDFADVASLSLLFSDSNISNSASPISCAAEKALRTAINTLLPTGRTGPMIIRAIFHDGVDENNLVVRNKNTKKWEPLEGDVYGGVDGCLYSSLSEGTHGSPEPSHNRNIPSSFPFAQSLCKQLCAQSKASICTNIENCVVDMTVLGSIVTIEKAGGPTIPMTWGRKKGPCENMIETPFAKDPAKIATYDHKPALRFAPSLTGIDDADNFRQTFQRLGFDASDQAALMGAHTFGKLAVCAGGLNGIEHGPFCNKPDKLDPPLTEANFVPTCTPKVGVVGNCWSKGKNWLVPVFATAGSKTKNGFGDGGFWDRTPTQFDNDYFKLFADQTYAGKDQCCGKIKSGGCHRGGTMTLVTGRNRKGAIVKSKRQGSPCSVKWCRSDRKGRTHMKSTQTWHEARHDFVKKGFHHGVTKRMVRLAGDWALLGNKGTKAAVEKFADSQEAFFEAFKKAWGKLISKGYSDLQTCEEGGTVPKFGVKPPRNTGAPKFQGETGCRDTHRKCHTMNNAAKKCKGGIWAKRCPYSCGLCKTGDSQSSAPASAPSPAPTPASTPKKSTCQDRHRKCKAVKKNPKACKNPRWKKLCPATCGECAAF
mmetsp:Transcript_52960/g.95248  ORF Transcript_52960/g.95248 Transcript_52960/m.95248 type:complete len:695 (-) Transcript_52960:50-2134(-)